MQVGIESELFQLVEEVLTREEARRAFPYKCPSGHWTIGIGHNLDDEPLPGYTLDQLKQQGLNEVQIEELFAHDLRQTLVGLEEIFGQLLPTFSDLRQAALISMHFQMGDAMFRGFHHMIAAIKADRWELAALDALDSKWAKEETPERAIRTALMMGLNTFPY